MEITRIEFEKLNNTRDLGQFTSSDGRRIRPRTLLRSGHLHELCLEDRAILKNDYRLKTIIDFRTEAERQAEPDTRIMGVNYLWIPLMNSETLGISYTANRRTSALNMCRAIQEKTFHPEEFMKENYRRLIRSPLCREGYRRFFNTLLDAPTDGSILWHCTAGKDRVGIATFFLLQVLGVPFDDVMDDYLSTNSFGMDSLNQLIALCVSYGVSKDVIPALDALFRVSEDYITTIFDEMERGFGGLYAYLENELGMTAEKCQKMRDKYLIG